MPRIGLRTTAAWKLAGLATTVFAVGSAGVFAAAYLTLAASIRSRSDTWLEGELALLADTAGAASPETLAQELHHEVRELTSRRLAPAPKEEDEGDEDVDFFAVLDRDGRALQVAATASWDAIAGALDAQHLAPGPPRWLTVPGLEYPVRMASRRLADGRTIVAGQSSSVDQALLEETTENLSWVWGAVTLFGFAVSWFAARRVLSRVDRVTALAAAIEGHQLDRRLPHEGRQHDEIARLVETFNVLLERIQMSVTQVRTIADALAHDLRSPVTSIRGSLEVALTSADDEQLRGSVAAALDGLDQLSATLDASLDTTEGEAGALRLHRSNIDLTELADGLVELYAPAAQSRGLDLSLRHSGPVVAWADETLLRRALGNLLDNALAHVPGGSHVEVGVSRDADRAVISVKDDGPGFSDEVRDHAFDRYVRGRHSTGAGLGLALVRAAALAHDGAARLGRVPAGGSVIEIEIPVGKPDSPASA